MWDMASRKCLHRFADDGCVRGKSIAVSPSAQMVACGSCSGVVNVYETKTVLGSAAPQPSKALLHLVTAATSLQFNPTSQILAMSSDEKDGALKLVGSVTLARSQSSTIVLIVIVKFAQF